MSKIKPKTWQTVKLGDIVTLNYGQSLPKRNRVHGDIPVYSSAGLIDWHNKAFVKSGGIIVGRKGTIGSVYKSEKPFFPIDTVFYILKEKNYDLRFLFYALSNLGLEKLNSDTAVPGLNRNMAYAQEISLPLLSEQKAIAETLGSLDDKIDLLHRQNKTLEGMAQTLFRQWFIQKASNDWEKKPLSYFGYIVCGKTPPKNIHEYFGDKIPFIKIPDMHGNTFVFKTEDGLTELGQNYQNNKTIPEKSICVSCIATVGIVSMNAFKSQTNQQINSIIPKKNHYRYFIYLFMKSSQFLLQTMASGGTATMNLNTGDFSKIIISKPNQDILIEFHNIVRPLFKKVFHNQSQMLKLEKLREALLSKLINGSARVRGNSNKR